MKKADSDTVAEMVEKEVQQKSGVYYATNFKSHLHN